MNSPTHWKIKEFTNAYVNHNSKKHLQSTPKHNNIVQYLKNQKALQNKQKFSIQGFLAQLPQQQKQKLLKHPLKGIDLNAVQNREDQSSNFGSFSNIHENTYNQNSFKLKNTEERISYSNTPQNSKRQHQRQYSQLPMTPNKSQLVCKPTETRIPFFQKFENQNKNIFYLKNNHTPSYQRQLTPKSYQQQHYNNENININYRMPVQNNQGKPNNHLQQKHKAQKNVQHLTPGKKIQQLPTFLKQIINQDKQKNQESQNKRTKSVLKIKKLDSNVERKEQQINGRKIRIISNFNGSNQNQQNNNKGSHKQFCNNLFHRQIVKPSNKELENLSQYVSALSKPAFDKTMQHSQSEIILPKLLSSRKSTYYISTILDSFGASNPTIFQQISMNHLSSSFQFFNKPPLTKKNQTSKICRKLPKTDKITIVFDLDETLVHCTSGSNIPYDYTISMNLPNNVQQQVHFNLRPWAIQCLKALKNQFQLMVFTASHKCYGNPVIDKILDPKKQFFAQRYFRDDCIATQQGMYIKDLRVIDRDPKKLLLIDNAAYSYCMQIDNGVPIIPFFDDRTDRELKNLIQYIKQFKDIQDVRIKNAQILKIRRYRQGFRNVKQLLNELYNNEQDSQH